MAFIEVHFGDVAGRRAVLSRLAIVLPVRASALARSLARSWRSIASAWNLAASQNDRQSRQRVNRMTYR